jgi:ribosome assembly protein 1
VADQVTHVRAQVENCETVITNDTEPEVVVFVSKMTAVKVRDLSPSDAELACQAISKRMSSDSSQQDTVTDIRDREVFIALARVFSGTLRSHNYRPLYLLGHRHNPFEAFHEVNCKEDAENVLPSSVKEIPTASLGLYLCLGPSIAPVDEVPAGNIVGIFGLEDIILRTGTICSDWKSSPLKSITFQAKPMLRVAVEPIHHCNLKNLEFGLQQLYQYDPVVEIGIESSTDQNTITCLGELHLELCLKALTERFAKYVPLHALNEYVC